MQVFYEHKLTTDTDLFEINQNEANHITKVLRYKVGQTLIFSDGNGNKYTCELKSNNPKNCTAIVTNVELVDPMPYELHIAIAPTKKNDRIEFFVEKAVEIGITEITPIICRYSERRKINIERLEKISIAASKQSLKFYKPKINTAVDFNSFVSIQYQDFNKFIALCESDESIFNLKNNNKKYIFVIGPEGGFDFNEINIAKKNKFYPVKLNNYRLRTETAGVYAAVLTNVLNLL